MRRHMCFHNGVLQVMYPEFYIDYVHSYPRKPQVILHNHDTWEMMLVENGESQIFMDRQSFRVRGPYLVCYPPQVNHYQINSAEHYYCRYCFSMDTAYFMAPIPDMPENGYVLPLTEEQCTLLAAPLSHLYAHFAEPSPPLTPVSRERREHLLRWFLGELNGIRQGGEALMPVGSYIHRVCAYLHTHLADSPSLDELSRCFHISRTKLTREFRAEFGLSVGEYLDALRLYQADRLFTTGLSMEEIAEICGFSSGANFVHFFKRVTGMTPTEYRKKYAGRANETLDLRVQFPR